MGNQGIPLEEHNIKTQLEDSMTYKVSSNNCVVGTGPMREAEN